jgi:hypothetical protein
MAMDRDWEALVRLGVDSLQRNGSLLDMTLAAQQVEIDEHVAHLDVGRLRKKRCSQTPHDLGISVTNQLAVPQPAPVLHFELAALPVVSEGRNISRDRRRWHQRPQKIILCTHPIPLANLLLPPEVF